MKGVVVCAFWIALQVLGAQTDRPSEVTVGTEKFVRAPANMPRAPLSSAELQAMRQSSEAMRAAADALVDNNPPSPPGLPLVRDPRTELVNPRLILTPATPDTFVLGKSVINPNLPLPGQTSIVEPSVSNMSLQAFYLSNDRADFTSDGGLTFTQVPIPGGPPDAPNFCCDQTIVYDPSHSMWLWSRLYTKGINGVVQIYAVGIFEPLSARSRTAEEARGPSLLADLAEISGGRMFSVEDPNELPDIAEKISIELRNQYVLGYRPSNLVRDGRWRRIKVKLSPPKGLPPLQVYARTGYYAPTQ